MAGGSENITTGQYIGHHLQNLTFGNHPENGWSFAHSAAEAQAMGFWAFHVDTMFWSLVLGVVFLLMFRTVAKKAGSAATSLLHRPAGSAPPKDQSVAAFRQNAHPFDHRGTFSTSLRLPNETTLGRNNV